MTDYGVGLDVSTRGNRINQGVKQRDLLQMVSCYEGQRVCQSASRVGEKSKIPKAVEWKDFISVLSIFSLLFSPGNWTKAVMSYRLQPESVRDISRGYPSFSILFQISCSRVFVRQPIQSSIHPSRLFPISSNGNNLVCITLETQTTKDCLTPINQGETVLSRITSNQIVIVPIPPH